MSTDRPVVLVVDDDAGMRQTYRDLLEDEGYATLTARDGAEGLATLDELDDDPDLVVLDAAMPLISGEQVLECLRSRPGSDELRVLVVTAHPTVAASLRAQGVPVLRKPFDIAAFIDVVHQRAGGDRL